jgi:hypothetical protein
LRRNFFKPLSFEAIFCAALALHCGIHRAFGSAAEKQDAPLQLACANTIMTSPQSAWMTEAMTAYDAGLFELRAFGGVTRPGNDPS